MALSIPIITEFNGKGIEQARKEFAQLEGVGKKAGFALKKAFVPALAVVGGGIKIAKDSIDAFASYEEALREVFTLMPGLSAQAEKDISNDVKTFSKNFGVLPNEVIPALYQAISAGVPSSNVFAFLETAQQAAKGGVTDLATAVDGISSVVNAYGSEVIDATKASDLMFTAVKLGKTDFNQLSGSLFQVAPIAAALGVDFEFVTAALATLTAQGTPTAVAATQMKSAMSELGKQGTKADEAFRKITGKSFPNFIKDGGKVDDAFMLIADGAKKSGQSVMDVFGSIEAGQAILSLTANEGKAFSDALAQMGDSSGATEDAFTTMEEGINPALDKMKANFEVLKIEIASKFAPVLEKVFKFVGDNMDIFAIFGGVLLGVSTAIVLINLAMAANPFTLIALGVGLIVAGLIVAYKRFEGFRTVVDKVFQGLKTGIGMAIDNFKMMLGVVKGIFNGIGSAWNNTFGKISFKIPNIPGLPGRGTKVEFPKIPALADGGIVTGPTLALIGEAGPEAVIPLDRAGSRGGGDVNIYVQGADPNAVVDALRTYMFRNGSVPIRVS
jgi:TP901 family phage tail tape measure protein